MPPSSWMVALLLHFYTRLHGQDVNDQGGTGKGVVVDTDDTIFAQSQERIADENVVAAADV